LIPLKEYNYNNAYLSFPDHLSWKYGMPYCAAWEPGTADLSFLFELLGIISAENMVCCIPAALIRYAKER
jgi:hypothetical protein